LRKEEAAVEEKVVRLEEEKTAREKELCEPETCKIPGRIKLLNQELRTISLELEDLYDHWHSLSQELEDIESANFDEG